MHLIQRLQAAWAALLGREADDGIHINLGGDGKLLIVTEKVLPHEALLAANKAIEQFILANKRSMFLCGLGDVRIFVLKNPHPHIVTYQDQRRPDFNL